MLVTEPPLTKDRRSHSRQHLVLLLGVGLVYLLIFCQAIPAFVDEAYSFNLASDKSLRHMFSALRNGADGSFPLYALLVFGWEKVFGSSELSLRLNSCLFVLLFVWQTNRRLSVRFGPAIAALTLLFVVANKILTYYALQARFYGLVIFLFSLCFWSTWDLLQSQPAPRKRQILHALICGLLCVSHPLGLIYTGILAVLYVGFSWVLKRFSFSNSLSFLGGPALFLLWLPSFLSQRLVNPVYDNRLLVPGWYKYWQFVFFDDMLLFLTCLAGLVLFALGQWCSGAGQKKELIGTDAKEERVDHFSRTVLISYSLAFILSLNLILALLDAFRIIPVYWMLAVRYVLVCWAAYCPVIAMSLKGIVSMVQRNCTPRWKPRVERIQYFAVAAGLLVLLEAHWGEWFKARASELAYLGKISKIAGEKHLPVVCESHWDAFYLATRTSTERVAYILQDDFAYKKLMLQIAKYYPRPEPISPTEERNRTNEFVYLTDSPKEARIVTPTKR